MNDNNIKLDNVQEANDVITKEDIARAIHSIAYRKAYSARPDVKAKRKEYSKQRAWRMKKVMEWMKENPTMTGGQR